MNLFKSKMNIAILTTIIAIFLHLYLTKQYYGLKFGQAETSVCNLNATFNCDAASASQYSNIFTIPLALLGVLVNFLLLACLLFQKFNFVANLDRASRINTWLALFIAAVSIVMGSISSLLLQTYCLFCIGAYALSFIGLYLINSSKTGALVKNMKEDFLSLTGDFKTVAISFFIVVPLLAYIINDVTFENSPLKDIGPIALEKVVKWQKSEEYKFDSSLGLIKKAKNGNAKLTVVEFADFRCPHCKHAYPSLHAFANAHPDIDFVFKSYPLDGTCNPTMKGGGDGISCELAFITFCAEKIAKKGWEAHDFLFDNQERIVRLSRLDDIKTELSKNLSLNPTELESCIKSEDIFKQIQTMSREGENAKLTGTPAIYLNGRFLEGAHLLPIVEAAYKTLPK